tara:strand:+ start:753 stop:1100 length:348 start_codon:yes stop_codon:yes gene_type:complete
MSGIIGGAGSKSGVIGAGTSSLDTIFGTEGTASHRFTVDSSGHMKPAADNSYDLGSTSLRWANIYTHDLNLNNTGSGGNEVDGTEGRWTIQEGEDNLYLINRKTNKKYKFILEEV